MSFATLLVNVESGQSNAHLLRAAAKLATLFRARLIGITVCAPIQLLYADGYVGGEIFEQDRLEIDRQIAAAEVAFRHAMGAEGHDFDWRSCVTFGPLANYLAVEARCADLVLTSAPSKEGHNPARQVNLADLILQSGRPVLVVAPELVAPDLDRVMIAWKDTTEARRAAADALPVLRMATSVSLVEIAPEDGLVAAKARLADVAGWLARHNVIAECHALASHGDDSEQLEAVAREHRAGLVVAGAYGHSRVREWALGGVTRSLLGQASRSVFTSH